jgi:hypothetical protein
MQEEVNEGLVNFEKPFSGFERPSEREDSLSDRSKNSPFTWVRGAGVFLVTALPAWVWVVKVTTPQSIFVACAATFVSIMFCLKGISTQNVAAGLVSGITHKALGPAAGQRVLDALEKKGEHREIRN